MLVAILVVFGVCWLPYQITLLYSELRRNRITVRVSCLSLGMLSAYQIIPLYSELRPIRITVKLLWLFFGDYYIKIIIFVVWSMLAAVSDRPSIQ